MADALPPLPQGDAPAIYVQTAQGQGPAVTAAQLSSMLASGQLGPDAAIWYQGLAGWVRVADHPELSPRRPSSDDEHDRVFGELVKESWAYYKEHEQAGHVDEVLVGAIITVALDHGYSLIDLNSDGSHHYLRFENIGGDHSRMVFQLTHLTPGLAAARVLGQRMSVIVGYGEKMADFGRIWQALKAEFKSGYVQNPEPGTITVDGDVASGYVYVQVDLYLDIKHYIGERYAIDYKRLARDMNATVNALRKYLRGRFGRLSREAHMLDLLNKFNHKAEIRESKDEILVGELVRAMARQGCPAVSFWSNNDFQRVCFKCPTDPVLSSIFVTLDRKTGTGALTGALFGSKATLTITGAVKIYLTDPDDIVNMYRTDLANLFKLPVLGGIRLNHELNSVYATTALLIDIDNYVLKGEPGVQAFMGVLSQTIASLRPKLAPYKR